MSDIYGNAETVQQMEAELGQTFRMADSVTNYPCIVGAREDTRDLGLGGFAGGATIEIVCRRELFSETTMPMLDDTIYLNFKAHKIISRQLSPDGALVVIGCDDVNKDA